jgi:hypothetical protein
MYKGVPTILYILIVLHFFFANPKSPILARPFESMTFAGFKSLNNPKNNLWTIPDLTRERNPLQISVKMVMALFYWNFPYF